MGFEDIKNDINKFKGTHPFVFLGLVVYLGGLIIYVLIYLIFFADHSAAMSLNEVGDFLAGAFSPLAFLFLYLGYKQQGDEMSRNTAALEAQQIELKKSVEAQNALIELHEKEQYEKHIQVLPNFVISDKNAIRKAEKVNEYDEENDFIDGYDEEFLDVSFSLLNVGETAKNVLVQNTDYQNPVHELEYSISRNEKIEIKMSFNSIFIRHLEDGATIDNVLILTYNNLYGKVYEKQIIYHLRMFHHHYDGQNYINFDVKIK